MAGLLEPEDLTAVDDEGVSLGVRMADIGGDLDRIHEALRRRGDLAAYFELHIEQGPSLHQSNTPIGVVTGITGRAVFGVEIRGTANHAGTTPMPARHDALVSAAKLALAVNRVAGELEICRVATTGTLQVHPNAVNVVPGRVNLGVEFRDVDMNALSGAEVMLRRTAAEISPGGRRRGGYPALGRHPVGAHQRRDAAVSCPGCRTGGLQPPAPAQRRGPRRPGHGEHYQLGHDFRAQRGRRQPLPRGILFPPGLRQRRPDPLKPAAAGRRKHLRNRASMKVTGTYTFNAPAAQVWDTLMDPQVLAGCIPGCEGLEPTGEGAYQAVINVGIGPVRGRYNAKIMLLDRVPPRSYRLVIEGNGSIGFANGEAQVTLVDEDGRTTVNVDSDAQAGGTVARVGQRMMGSVAKGMLDRFFGCLQQSAQ